MTAGPFDVGINFFVHHEKRNLFPTDRTSQIAKCPSRLEHDRLILMNVVHQKHSALELGQNAFHFSSIKRRSRRGRGPFQPFENSRLVSLGLQATEEPSPRIRKALVVDIDGVLCGENHTQSECASLL